MRTSARFSLLLAAILVLPAGAQRSRREPAEEPSTTNRLPNGKLQSDAILKAEHEKTLQDAAKLVEMAEKLKADIEKNDKYVLSIDILKQAEEIEKMAKKIRTRIRR